VRGWGEKEGEKKKGVSQETYAVPFLLPSARNKTGEEKLGGVLAYEPWREKREREEGEGKGRAMFVVSGSSLSLTVYTTTVKGEEGEKSLSRSGFPCGRTEGKKKKKGGAANILALIWLSLLCSFYIGRWRGKGAGKGNHRPRRKGGKKREGGKRLNPYTYLVYLLAILLLTYEREEEKRKSEVLEPRKERKKKGKGKKGGNHGEV